MRFRFPYNDCPQEQTKCANPTAMHRVDQSRKHRYVDRSILKMANVMKQRRISVRRRIAPRTTGKKECMEGGRPNEASDWTAWIRSKEVDEDSWLRTRRRNETLIKVPYMSVRFRNQRHNGGISVTQMFLQCCRGNLSVKLISRTVRGRSRFEVVRGKISPLVRRNQWSEAILN